jgi:hypothetical protein
VYQHAVYNKEHRKKLKFLKGVGKIFSKIFLTGVWGGAPRKQKTKTSPF